MGSNTSPLTGTYTIEVIRSSQTLRERLPFKHKKRPFHRFNLVDEMGVMVIKAHSGATIKNDFTLKKGATLTIDPNFIELTDIPEE